VNREARVDVRRAEGSPDVGHAIAVRVAQRRDAAGLVRGADLGQTRAQRDEYVAVVAHGDVARSGEIGREQRHGEALRQARHCQRVRRAALRQRSIDGEASATATSPAFCNERAA
jgi:hypothetical protein